MDRQARRMDTSIVEGAVQAPCCCTAKATARSTEAAEWATRNICACRPLEPVGSVRSAPLAAPGRESLVETSERARRVAHHRVADDVGHPLTIDIRPRASRVGLRDIRRLCIEPGAAIVDAITSSTSACLATSAVTNLKSGLSSAVARSATPTLSLSVPTAARPQRSQRQSCCQHDFSSGLSERCSMPDFHP